MNTSTPVKVDLNNVIEFINAFGPIWRSDIPKFAAALLSHIDSLPTPVQGEMERLRADVVAIGSIRLQRLVKDGGLDLVTVDVERDGEWIEVIRELHNNYFDHFVSPSGIRSAVRSNKHDPL